MEPGEDVFEAAKREVLEETGIQFDLTTLLAVESAGETRAWRTKLHWKMNSLRGVVVSLRGDGPRDRGEAEDPGGRGLRVAAGQVDQVGRTPKARLGQLLERFLIPWQRLG